VTYVFDEPTIGLHPHDIQRHERALLRLRDKGNTVLVVEHKPEVVAIADHVVDLGPGAGSAGGEVVFEGSVERCGRAERSRAGTWPTSLAQAVGAQADGTIKVRGARAHNSRT
jgi:excinuclease UvrABC ATPase subunit